MATTTKEYTGDGSKGIAGQEVLTFDFPYLKTEDIKVSLNGATLTTNKYTFPTATSIQFTAIFPFIGGGPTTLETNTQENTGAPKTGVKILIYRDTDVDAAKAVFAAGSSIRSRDLNNNKDQDLFFQQEVQDPANPKNKSTSLNGTGAPDQGLGKEGDVYIDTTNNALYGPKTNGAWGSGTNLAGVTSAELEALTWNTTVLNQRIDDRAASLGYDTTNLNQRIDDRAASLGYDTTNLNQRIDDRAASLGYDTTTLNSRIDTRADARIAADATIPTISQVENLTYNTQVLNQRIDDRAASLGYDTTTLNSRIDTRADQRIASSAIAITSVQTAANEAAQLALTTQEGDIVVRSDQNKSYVRNSGTAGTMADFTELLTPTDQVLSVNSNTGAITANQIAAAVEAADDSNTFTNADHTKLNNIEASATADQTDTEIKTAYENNSDTNAFTDAEKTKLSGIETGATADQTDAEIKTAYENNSDTNAFTDAEKTKLSGIETSATADQTDAEIRAAVEAATDSNVFTDADHTKLNGIETGATADQTGSEIKSLYEGESDTNAFTDAEKTKLSGIEASADVTDTTNVAAAGAAMLTGATFTGNISLSDDVELRFGNDNDLKIYHSSNNFSYIEETNTTGSLRLRGESLLLEDLAGDNYVYCIHDAEVRLYYDNAAKLYTTSYGIEVRGDGSSQDGAIQFNCSQNSHGVKIQSPPHSANASYTLTLPNTDGNANQVLKSDGSGNLDWVDQPTAYTNSNVDSHLNTSSASSSQVLSWNGSDYAWVAQSSGGGGGSMNDLVDDTTPQLGGNLDMQANNISGTGTVIAASTAVATAGMRKIHASQAAPSGSDGAVGDIWVKY